MTGDDRHSSVLNCPNTRLRLLHLPYDIEDNMAKNTKTRFFYVLYSDRTCFFTNQSAGPIYIIKGNKPVVKFIRNCIRDSSEEFPILSLLRILKTSFRLFVQTVSFPSCLRYEFYFRSHGSNQYFTHSLRLLVKFYFSQPEKKTDLGAAV